MFRILARHPVTLGVAVALSAVPAIAQQSRGGLEEIVVTAQKREQAVLDVPITLTAYTGDFLDQIGVEDFERLSAFVPGLVVQEQSPNNPGFVIRGITSDSGSAQIAPRVSVFQDGIDISRSRGSIVELYDLERVEVLKGPQATLFGTAASIGAISLISAPPGEDFEGQASFGVGNFGERRSRGYVSGPLLGSETFGARVAWLYRSRDGFVDNVDGPALNGKDTTAVRGYLRFEPTNTFQADLILNWQRDTPPGTSFKSGVVPPVGGDLDPGSFAQLGPFGRQPNDFLGGPIGLDRTVGSITARATWDFAPAWQFTSISNFREFDSLEVFDADGTRAYWLEFAEDASGKQWSQEFRLNFDDGGRLSTFFGATWFHEEGEQRVPFSTDEGVFAACTLVLGVGCFLPDGSVASVLPVPIIYEDAFANTGDNDALSFYADASWQFSDQWRATLGLRYVTERKTSGFYSLGVPSVVGGGLPLLSLFGVGNTGGLPVFSDRKSFDDLSPRFVLDYAPADNWRLYGSIAKGRRSNVVDVGGIPGPIPSLVALVEVLPDEIIWSYEIGVKAELMDERLRFDAGVFYQDYSDFQTTIFDDAGQLQSVNAGEATNFGVEAAVIASLADGLDVFANVGWIDASFDDTDGDGNPALFAGNRFRLQPTWSWSAGATWRYGLTSTLEGFTTLTWNYRSRVFFEEDNAPVAGVDILQDNLHLVDARAGFGSRDGRWELTAYANNLFDERYIIDAGNTGAAFGTPTLIAGPPRLYGVEAILRFGR